MSLPSSMTFIDTAGAGDPSVLRLATGPLPQAKPDEVLIRVMAAGVNRPDVQQRRGAYPPPPGASPVIGLEVAGEVVATGERADRWKVGDKVCALANGGGYAEYCTAPQGQCLPWPKGFDAIRAAALPETYFTVWANVFQIGGLSAGQSFLVHGGTSGIGVTAIQLAREFGAKVYATAGSAEKCEACTRLGADGAINYRETDFVQAIREYTGGAGVNMILDMVGAPYLPRNLRCLAVDGKLVLIAFLGGSKVENLDFVHVMTRRLTITGSTMRPRSSAQKAAIAADLLAKVWPVLDAGRCQPVIYKVFKLSEAAEAHRLMESSTHIGKIVLDVAP